MPETLKELEDRTFREVKQLIEHLASKRAAPLYALEPHGDAEQELYLSTVAETAREVLTRIIRNARSLSPDPESASWAESSTGL